MTPLTTAEIEAGLELAKKATKRPWAVDPFKTGTPWNIESVDEGYDIAMAQQQRSPKDDPKQSDRHANAGFICTAANHYESLAAEVLALRKENADLRAVVERLRAILRDLEWANPSDDGEDAYCAFCMSMDGEQHAPECAMSLALAEAARTEARNAKPE